MSRAGELVLANLPLCESPELDKVRAALALLGASRVAEKEARGQDILLDAIASLLGESVVALKRRKSYKTYQEKRTEAEIFLNRICAQSKQPSRVRYQAAQIAVKALAELLKDRRMFFVGTMLLNIDKLPEAVELAFPGYIARGMFGFVLDRSLD